MVKVNVIDLEGPRRAFKPEYADAAFLQSFHPPLCEVVVEELPGDNKAYPPNRRVVDRAPEVDVVLDSCSSTHDE